MTGKSVILAGGSGGLGGAAAEAIAARGGVPVIGCRSNRQRAEQLGRELLQRYQVRAPIVEGDILQETVRQELIKAADDAGQLYGLVLLVGKPARVALEYVTEADLIDSMQSNFIAPVLLARDFAAHLEGRDASIVFVST